MAERDDSKPAPPGVPSAEDPYASGPQGPPSGAAPEAPDAAPPYNPYGPPPGAQANAPYAPHGPAGTPPLGAQPGQGPSPYPAPAAYPVLERPPFPGVGWFLLLVLIGFALNAGIGAIGLYTSAIALGAKPADLATGKALEVIPPALLFGMLLLASLAWPAVALTGARIARSWSKDHFRWRHRGIAPTGVALLLGVGLVPVALTIEHAMSRVTPRGDNILVQVMTQQPGTLAMVLLGVTLVVAAPVGEELLFRGLGLRGLERRHGLWPAAMIISLVFAAVHLNITGFPALLLVSLLLCWVTSRTDSLIPAIALHASYNGVQYVMMIAGDHSKEAVNEALASTAFPLPPWLVAIGFAITAICIAVLSMVTPAQTTAVD